MKSTVCIPFLLAGLSWFGCRRPDATREQLVGQAAPSAPVPAEPSAARSAQPAATAERPSLASACPKGRPARVPSATTPALDTNPVLLPLLTAGASGTPQRARLRFHHPIAGCECPSFSLSDYRSGIGDDVEERHEGIFVLGWTHVVFPDGVPSGHEFESGKFMGSTEYQFVGYFSGRMVDFYEWARVQNNAGGERIGGEQEADREARYPEFCVEDWCYIPDPDPVMYKEVKSASTIAADRREYERVIARMRSAGARLCASAGRPRR